MLFRVKNTNLSYSLLDMVTEISVKSLANRTRLREQSTRLTEQRLQWLYTTKNIDFTKLIQKREPSTQTTTTISNNNKPQ